MHEESERNAVAKSGLSIRFGSRAGVSYSSEVSDLCTEAVSVKIGFQSVFAVYMIAALPLVGSAQKKSTTGSTSAEHQKLSDAYAVLVNLISDGAGQSLFFVDNKHLSTTYYRQTNVASSVKPCLLGWDVVRTNYGERDGRKDDVSSDDEKKTRFVVPLAKLDLHSFATHPFSVVTTKDKENWSYTYSGFALTWSYLEQNATNVPSSLNPDDKPLGYVRYVYLSTQEDTDRFIKAMTYAAKTCGAHETAF